MITRKMILSISAFALLILVLSIEKIKLSWEIRTLHNNYENFRVENENLKDLNLRLITQFYIENSPASIEKVAKESLLMEKKKPKRIILDEQ